MIKVVPSSILSALRPKALGSRVTNVPAFEGFLVDAISETDFDGQRVPGQAFIPMPGAEKTVSCGLGRRTEDPKDYAPRMHRGRVDCYLKRKCAAPTDSLAVVVYTAESYENDPQVDAREALAIRAQGGTHVLVAVLANPAGAENVVGPFRFVANLAGGNREYKLMGGKELRDLAKKVVQNDEKWCVVSD